MENVIWSVKSTYILAKSKCISKMWNCTLSSYNKKAKEFYSYETKQSLHNADQNI